MENKSSARVKMCYNKLYYCVNTAISRFQIMDQKRKTLYIIYSAVLFLIFLGFLYLAILINASKPFSIEQNNVIEENNPDVDLCVTLPSTKNWMDNGNHANQYDGTVYNNTNHNVVDWAVTIKLPEHSRINDSWNIIYENNADGTTTIRNNPEQGFNDYIAPGEDITFGFILFSYENEEFTSFKIDATPEPRITDYPLFYILCVLFVVFISCASVSVAFSFKEKQFDIKRERDRQIIVQSMKTFSNFIDAKDEYTRGHSLRVAYYTRKIAQKLDFDEDALDNIYYIALLHDVGKIYIPDEILMKPGKLTDDEMNIIKTHTTKGATILKDFSSIPSIMDGAEYHHERFDGTGYPSGLKGEEIPLVARIIGVADAYDAMNSNRCYRPAFPKEKIIEELKKYSGLQFDPDIVKIMLELLQGEAFANIESEINE